MRARLLALSVLVSALFALPGAGRPRSISERFEAAKRDEPSLIAFLRGMPKGADLHNHLGGALYTEDGLREAVKHSLYYNPATFLFQKEAGPGCVPAARLRTDDRLREGWMDRATTRGAPDTPAGGHDHFFHSFPFLLSPFQETDDVEAMLPVLRRARLQNLQYLELMQAPGTESMARIRAAAASAATHEEMLAKIRPLLDDYLKEARAELDRWDREASVGLDQPAPLSAADRPLTVRYLATAFRGGRDSDIFSTWAAAFALMRVDHRLVGVNFAAPEDGPNSQERFDAHMKLLDFLWPRFDRPKITLHAGELNPYVSPLEDMTHHIRRSIDVGHALRIGHGTGIAWETDCMGLLKQMRERGIAVEICPTSEAVILRAEGDRHPFRLYRNAGVPITLNTDDEGVLRTNITMEFVRAARSWNLSYADLKELARNSIEYSFLPGESLFEGHDYRRVRSQYRALAARGWSVDEGDRGALAASDRATVQARLERAFVEFER
jgi:adenosine deaminase